MPDLIPVVELLRVSTETQREKLGLAAQRHANRETATRYGLQIAETVQIVMSGAEVAETPEMHRVLTYLETGQARGIVVAAYDRLFRPEKWSDMLVLQRIQDAGAGIYTPNGEIDLSTDLGHMQATLYNLFAAMERRRIRDRMAAGREEKRRRGDHVGFKCSIPFGLDWSEEDGWMYTPEIEIVRELFRRFLAGEHSYVRLADELGLPRTSTRFILMNEVYTGWRVYDEKRDLSPTGKYAGGDRRKIKRHEHEVIRVRLRSADGTPLEPVVSPQQYRAVQAIIERGRLSSARAQAQTQGHFVYRGVLFCACEEICYCHNGGRYKDGSPKHFYHCKTRHPRHGPTCGASYMSAHKLEPALDGVLSKRLSDRRFLRRALSAYADSLQESRPQVDRHAVRSAITRLEAQKARVIDAFVDGVLTKAQRDERLARIAQEQERYGRLKQEAPAPAGLDVDAIHGVVRVFARFPHIRYEGKRGILESLAPRIYVRDYEPLGLWLDGRLWGGDTDSLLQKVDNITTSSGGLYIPLAA